MGLFDKIKDFVNSGEIDKITETVGNTVNTFLSEHAGVDRTNEAPASKAATPKASNDLLATGNILPKPCFTVEEEYGDKKYSFELSGDYIPFNSHCEFDPSYQYEPFSSEKYTAYNDVLPVVSIGPNDTIFDAAESFEKGEAVTKLNIKRCENPCFLFSTSFKEYDKIFYAYAFAAGSAREYEMLCVQYDPNIAGTALEKKLIAAVDNAAATYKEENIN